MTIKAPSTGVKQKSIWLKQEIPTNSLYSLYEDNLSLRQKSIDSD